MGRKPKEIALKNKIERLRGRLDKTKDTAAREALEAEINVHEQRLSELTQPAATTEAAAEQDALSEVIEPESVAAGEEPIEVWQEGEAGETDVPEEESIDTEENSTITDNQEPEEIIMEKPFDPLDRPVIRRDTVGSNAEASEPTTPPPSTDEEGFTNEEPFEEDTAPSPEDYVPPDEGDSAPEPEYATAEEEPEDTGSSGSSSAATASHDMNDASKRKNAKQTAAFLTQMYCMVRPVPYVKLTQVSKKKMAKMVIDGVIDANMELNGNITVAAWVEQRNKDVESQFGVDENIRKEIQTALYEYLLESNYSMTPGERLAIALAMDNAMMLMRSLQIKAKMDDAMKTFAMYHAERMNATRKTNTAPPPPPTMDAGESEVPPPPGGAPGSNEQEPVSEAEVVS